jgi:hypothetical protein
VDSGRSAGGTVFCAEIEIRPKNTSTALQKNTNAKVRQKVSILLIWILQGLSGRERGFGQKITCINSRKRGAKRWA